MENPSKFPSVSIVGTGSFVPQYLVDNIDLYDRVNNFEKDKAIISLTRKGHDLSHKTEGEIFDLWVQQVCGIKSRPFVSSQDSFFEEAKEKNLFVEYMAREASIKAIDDAKIDKKAIDHVIFSTYSSNRIMPSAGVTLAHLLGIDAPAVTMNGACSGFLDALIDAVVKIKSEAFNNILVVASEELSNKMNYQDPKSAIIFSDGAGAFVVSRSKVAGIKSFASGVDYSEQVYMERRGDIFFNSGPLVERNAVRTMKAIAIKAMEKNGYTFKDFDYIIPHQANVRILKSFQKVINFPESQVLKKIETLGNLSSASVPVALDLFLKNEFKPPYELKKLKLLLISVGGGYTFSAVITDFYIR